MIRGFRGLADLLRQQQWGEPQQQPTYQAFSSPAPTAAPTSLAQLLPRGGAYSQGPASGGVPQFFDQYTGEQRPATAQEVMASMPAGSVNWTDAIRAIDQSQGGINALQDPAVMQWLQQTQGYNPGVAGQVIAARQGGYDFNDPYVQSIMSFGRAPTQEELSAGWASVAQQLASRGDNSLEQAVQAGFFDQFPGFDRAAVDRYIASSQAARDSGGLAGQVQRGISNAADVTALSGIEELDPLREVLPLSFNPDVHERAAYATGLYGIGQAVSSGLPPYDASVGAEAGVEAGVSPGVGGFDPATGAGEFNTEYVEPDLLSDPHFDYSEFDPNSTLPSRSGVSPIGQGPTGSGPNVSPITAGTGGAAAAPIVYNLGDSNAQPSGGSGGSGGTGGTALTRIADGTATLEDYLSVGGTVGGTALGIWGANQQADALRDIANQARADRAPFLNRSLEYLNDPNAYLSGPGRAAGDAVLRGLSVHGNPAGMPSSMDIASEAALRDWRDAVTGFGNMGLAGEDTRASLMSRAAGADANALNAIGAGLADLTQPRRRTLAEMMNSFT